MFASGITAVRWIDGYRDDGVNFPYLSSRLSDCLVRQQWHLKYGKSPSISSPEHTLFSDSLGLQPLKDHSHESQGMSETPLFCLFAAVTTDQQVLYHLLVTYTRLLGLISLIFSFSCSLQGSDHCICYYRPTAAR